MDHAGFNNKHLLLGIMVYLFHGTCLSLAWILQREKMYYLRAEKNLIFTIFSLSDFTDLISQEIKRTDNGL